jgi:hypothetical protein
MLEFFRGMIFGLQMALGSTNISSYLLFVY